MKVDCALLRAHVTMTKALVEYWDSSGWTTAIRFLSSSFRFFATNISESSYPYIVHHMVLVPIHNTFSLQQCFWYLNINSIFLKRRCYLFINIALWQDATEASIYVIVKVLFCFAAFARTWIGPCPSVSVIWDQSLWLSGNTGAFSRRSPDTASRVAGNIIHACITLFCFYISKLHYIVWSLTILEWIKWLVRDVRRRCRCVAGTTAADIPRDV